MREYFLQRVLKKTTMKKSMNLLVVALVATIFFGCGSSNKDSVEQANDMNDDKDTSGSMMSIDDNDAKFLVEASDVSMMEVEAGNLAQQKSKTMDILSFGKMMTTDHTGAIAEVQSVASMKNVTMPTSMSEDHMKKLNDLREKSGTEFDKDYISMMVDGHKSVVNDFEKFPFAYKH